MTISNLRCDVCDVLLPGIIPDRPEAGPGPAGRSGGVRFSYHPGDPRMRDDSGVLCAGCWSDWLRWLGPVRPRQCAVCGCALARKSSLYLRDMADPQTWQLCSVHALELLNRLRTVEPKLDPETFQLPLARDDAREEEGALDV